jgi:bifunctional non-homologous end joining protein LigD
MTKYSPMLAKLGNKSDLELKNFTYEEKLDGTRAILYNKKGETKIINRRNNNITHRYPEFNFSIKQNCVLDGEIVIFNKKGVSEFNLLQHRDLLEDKKLIQERSKSMPATFVAFDILELNRKSLTKLPQKERFQILKKIINSSKNLKLIQSSKNGKQLFKKLTSKGGEGIIAKNPKEPYHEGKRRNAWIKIKKQDTIDGIIIGYTQEKRKLSTLLLAAYTNKNYTLGGGPGSGRTSKDQTQTISRDLSRAKISTHKLTNSQTHKLIYIGKVGTGFSEKEQYEILSKLEKIKTDKPTIEGLPKSTIHVKKKLIAEAKYLEITKDKKMRAPVFVKIRTDKKLKDCII